MKKEEIAAFFLLILSIVSFCLADSTGQDIVPCGELAGRPPLPFGDDVRIPVSPVPFTPAKFQPKNDKIFHGVHLAIYSLSSDFTQKMDQYNSYVSKTRGKKPSMIGIFVCTGGYNSPPVPWAGRQINALNFISSLGAIPHVKFQTRSYPDSDGRRSFWTADDILAGNYDAYFQEMADALRNFGKPVFLTLNHEMNGDWYPWSAIQKQGVVPTWTTEKYRQVWRKIHGIFKEKRATNVVFCFSPTLGGKKLDGRWDSWELYYPGDAYVDYLAISLYNNMPPEVTDYIVNQHPAKPIMYSEWAIEYHRAKWYCPAADYPGHEGWMRRAMHHMMYRYRDSFAGQVLFHQGDGARLFQDSLAAGWSKQYVDSINTSKFFHGPVDFADLHMDVKGTLDDGYTPLINKGINRNLGMPAFSFFLSHPFMAEFRNNGSSKNGGHVWICNSVGKTIRRIEINDGYAFWYYKIAPTGVYLARLADTKTGGPIIPFAGHRREPEQ